MQLIWSFSRGARADYVTTLVTMVIVEFLSFLSPLVVSNTIDAVLGQSSLRMPSWMAAWLTQAGGAAMLARNLWIPAAVLVGLMLIRGGFSYLHGARNARAAETIARNMRDRLYGHLQRLPYEYHVKAETGDLIQRTTTDVETVRRFLAFQLVQLARMVFMLTLALIILLGIHPMMTLFSLMLTPFIVLYASSFFRKIQSQFDKVEKADGHLSTVMQENFTGMRVVRAFGREAYEQNKFSVANQDLRKKVRVLMRFFAFFWSSSDLTITVQQLLSLTAGIWFAAQGQISIGDFIVFNSYVGMLLWPIRQFGRVLSDLGKMFIALGRIDEILSAPAETSGEDAQTPPLDGDIVFDGVSFSYNEKTPVLKDVSFTVKAGETIALLGSTGSGKSTLVQLLQRLYDYDHGSITIGGVDIKHIAKDHLRGRVGIVLQEPFLYSRSVKENIGIALPQPSDDLITESARMACIHDGIMAFEKGYDTVVGERGVTLSGGQKQRVAIARTIIRDSDILIFDDSLSAVDTETDAHIRQALRRRRRGVTTFIISHRISTLMEADRIFVLEDGRLTQQGSHGELKDQPGLYQRIWNIQSAIEAQEKEVQ